MDGMEYPAMFKQVMNLLILQFLLLLRFINLALTLLLIISNIEKFVVLADTHHFTFCLLLNPNKAVPNHNKARMEIFLIFPFSGVTIPNCYISFLSKVFIVSKELSLTTSGCVKNKAKIMGKLYAD